MNLLDEIINIAIDTKQSLPVLLRKCLLLAYELKNERLKSWANQELNGYDPKQELPDYRIMHIGTYANFTGPFGASMRNWPIPPAVLEEPHRDFARKVELRQAISCYEASVQSRDGSMTYTWPGDLCLYYQDKLVDGYVLVSAWQTVPSSAISGMIDTIRNRTLNMALEVKAELGNRADGMSMTNTDAEKISQSITHNIFNGPAYFASGTSQVQITNTGNETFITQGNRDALDGLLLKSGLSDPDVQELSTAMQRDGKRVGSSVTAWIARVSPKLVAAGVAASGKIAQSLITDWLHQYFGIH
jgi:hypothetical protein